MRKWEKNRVDRAISQKSSQSFSIRVSCWSYAASYQCNIRHWTIWVQHRMQSKTASPNNRLFHSHLVDSSTMNLSDSARDMLNLMWPLSGRPWKRLLASKIWAKWASTAFSSLKLRINSRVIAGIPFGHSVRKTYATGLQAKWQLVHSCGLRK